MLMKPNVVVWRYLLGSCRIHNNIEPGEHASRHLFELDPENVLHYVLLLNIFTTTSIWDEVEKVRKMMKYTRVEKCLIVPGLRSIKRYMDSLQEKNLIQKYKQSMQCWRNCLGKWSNLGMCLKSILCSMLWRMNIEQKEHVLCHHNEKLAIVLGFINTPPGTLTSVVKNLWI